HRADPSPVHRRGNRGGLALRLQGDGRQAVLRRYAQQPVRHARTAPVSCAHTARGAALLGLLALSGCGLFSSSSPKTTEACPSAVILRPLSNTAVFGSGPQR